jgi:TPR repeat protein
MMVRVILKCRYLKEGNTKHSENLVSYIARREGVQKIDDSRACLPATQEQQDFIRRLIGDFPDVKDSLEYTDFSAAETQGSASELITRAVEDHVDLIGKRENYVEYIAKRPRAERLGSHGLFTDRDVPIELSKVADEVAHHKGNVWTDVISLRREDAQRLGYDNAQAWRNLIRSQTAAIAENMKIPLEDLRWYAAYHDESYHPHVHMVIYSVGKEPYLSKQGIENLKSAFAKQIFKQDLLQIYAEETKQRNELTAESQNRIAEIVSEVNHGQHEDPVAQMLLIKLSGQLASLSGKMVYGYLPQSARTLVNAVVDQMAEDKRISELYDLWYRQREQIIGTYQSSMPKRIPLSQNKEFRAVRNAVVKEALNILHDRLTFEEASSEPTPDAPDDRENETDRPKPKHKDSAVLRQYQKAKKLLIKGTQEYAPAEAARLLRSCADQGYEYAQYRLGKMLIQGDEIERDADGGLELLYQAEKQNNEYAQYFLGKLFLTGAVVPQDFPRAEQLFEKSSDQGNGCAKYALSKMHLNGLAALCDERKAIRLLRESADTGNQWAQYLIGRFCFRGEHTDKDLAEAEKRLSAAADQNNSQAQYLLARYYLSGDGIPIQPDKAVLLLSKSAGQDNQYAQYQLGKMLLYGQSVNRNVPEGIRLLTNAAGQGNPYAARLLERYQTGSGMTPSAALASLRLFSYLASMLQNRLRDESDSRQIHADRKLMKRIAEKKQAHGLKME